MTNTIHNTLCAAYNSFSKGKMRSAMPNQSEFMQAMKENNENDLKINKLKNALLAMVDANPKASIDIGAPNSIARKRQEQQNAAFDMAVAALNA